MINNFVSDSQLISKRTMKKAMKYAAKKAEEAKQLNKVEYTSPFELVPAVKNTNSFYPETAPTNIDFFA